MKCYWQRNTIFTSVDLRDLRTKNLVATIWPYENRYLAKIYHNAQFELSCFGHLDAATSYVVENTKQFCKIISDYDLQKYENLK